MPSVRYKTSEIVDFVVIGAGAAGGIMAKELSEAGLKVVALERGRMRTPAEDFAVPHVRDEIRYTNRHEMMMNTATDTLTVRNKDAETALDRKSTRLNSSHT